MEIYRDNPKAACGCCATVAALVIAIAVLVFCAGTVEPIEYGLVFSTLSKNIDASAGVYEGGWYIIGPVNKFLSVPRTQVNVDFSELPGSKQKPVQVRLTTKNLIRLSFSFQYQLFKEKLTELYSLINMQYEKNQILTKAELAVKLEALNYTTDEYYGKRKEIGDAFCKAITREVVFAKCTGFQLLTIDFEEIFENSLTKTQVEKQKKF